MDCCHSGTGLDLPYSHAAYVAKQRKASRKAAKPKISPGTTICWSSCLDGQIAADMSLNGKFSGALTYFWMEAMKKHGGGRSSQGQRGTYHEILQTIWTGMKGKLTTINSIPVMSYNVEKFDVYERFSL